MRMIGTVVRRWFVLLLAVLAGGVISWTGWRMWDYRRDRAAIADVEDAIDNGWNGTAARKLHGLLERRPDWDEALYLLGTCEAARGRTQPAEEAWGRVAADSPFAPRAIFGRIQLRMDRGRFSEAEILIRDALIDPRVDAASLPILLGPILCHQGRLAETLRLLETRWNALNRAGEGASELAINLVRAHIDLQQSTVPVEVVRSVLDQAASLAPDDDRVWLGRANLAIRTGSYDDAQQWLDRCLKRRPEDAPVWRCRLDWAVTSRRVAEAREALRHLPVAEATPAEIARLAAWFAAQNRDHDAERRALERLLAVDPANRAGLERLAELSALQGDPARAAELRGRRVQIDQLEARYAALYRRNQPTRDAAEMASLAEQLGQVFQARAFLIVAIDRHPDDEDLRRHLATLEENGPSVEDSGRSLADVLATDPVPESGSSPATSSPSA